MSYILFLGFKTTVYKKPATIRVFLDDYLLDEFSLIPTHPCDQNNSSLQSSHYYKWMRKNTYNTHEDLRSVENISNFFHEDIIFKIFELDEKFIKEKQKHNLVIELIDSDNNFTNGFITKSTMISLYLAYLIPKSILINFSTFYNDFIQKKKELKKTHLDLISIVNSYKIKPVMFNLLFNSINLDKKYLLNWYSNITDKEEKIVFNSWIGSQGHFNLIFDIKQNIDIDINNTNICNECTLQAVIVQMLKNKYTEYENKRDTN